MNVEALGIPLQHETLKLIVRDILQQPPRLHGWSVQGLGMLRLYLGDVARLHIWDPILEAPNVSKMHTHSWRLRSLVVAGTIRNTRFIEAQDIPDQPSAMYCKQRIRAGLGGAVIASSLGEPSIVRLARRPVEAYSEGQWYQQEAAEIHFTDADTGTVTLVERKADGPGGEADVYYPYGGSWGPGFPRPADEYTIRRITQTALERWFK